MPSSPRTVYVPSSVAVTPILSLSAALAAPVPKTAVIATATVNPRPLYIWGFLLMPERRKTVSRCRSDALVRLGRIDKGIPPPQPARKSCQPADGADKPARAARPARRRVYESDSSVNRATKGGKALRRQTARRHLSTEQSRRLIRQNNKLHVGR